MNFALLLNFFSTNSEYIAIFLCISLTRSQNLLDSPCRTNAHGGGGNTGAYGDLSNSFVSVRSEKPRRAAVLNYFQDGVCSDTDDELLKNIRIPKVNIIRHTYAR